MLKISRENIWKETVVPYVIDNISIHVNPVDGECERSDIEHRSHCSSSENMDLQPAQSL